MTLADVKAELAALGQTLSPNAQMQVVPKPQDGHVNIIVLDRVVEGTLPEHCIHGYATCISCNELCWLGHNSADVVVSHKAMAMCMECAETLHKEGNLNNPPAYNVNDHLRADGPHA